MPTTRAPQPTGTEFRVNSVTQSGQTEPTITALAGGGFVATWESGYHSAIFAQRFGEDGARAGTMLRINATASGHHEAASVAALSDGGFVAAWKGPDPSGGSARYTYIQRFTADGARAGGEARLSGGSPAVASLADGGFVVSWHGPGADGTAHGVRAQKFTAEGVRAGGEFHVSTVTGGVSGLSTLSDGGYVLTWAGSSLSADRRTISYDIHAQRFAADGAAVGAVLRVGASASDLESDPVVAGLADGGFVVAWRSRYPAAGESYDIYAQHFAADGAGAGGEFRVNASAAYNQEAPAVVALADGGFVVSWEGRAQARTGEPDDTGVDIYAQRFSAAGLAMGGQFRVNSTAASNQFAPAAAAFGDSLVAAWSGPSGSGDYDIYAQRFTLPALVEEARIARNGALLTEGDAGGVASFAFTVELDAPAAEARSVRWRAEGAGANPAGASDFAGGALPSGTLVFAPGALRKTVTIAALGDGAVEADEGFTVRLSDPSAGLVLGTDERRCYHLQRRSAGRRRRRGRRCPRPQGRRARLRGPGRARRARLGGFRLPSRRSPPRSRTAVSSSRTATTPPCCGG